MMHMKLEEYAPGEIEKRSFAIIEEELGRELDPCLLYTSCLGFLLSRILSGLSIVYFPGAKKEGLLYAFSSTAHKRSVRLVLFFLLGVCVLGMVLVSPLAGSLTVAGNLAVFGWYRYDSKKEFGGITGDLAGWFLLCAEWVSAMAVSYTHLDVYKRQAGSASFP